MNQEFRESYEDLGLDGEADWPTIQATYRRLVNKWHPDRHQHSNTDKTHAQQEFIRVTRAFNDLRDFYREYHRLPLQRAPANNSAASATRASSGKSQSQHSTTASRGQRDAARNAAPHTAKVRTPRATTTPNLSDADMRSSSILGAATRRTESATRAATGKTRLSWWVLPLIVFAVIGTLLFMLTLDLRKANDLKLRARGVAIEESKVAPPREIASELGAGSEATSIQVNPAE